jgi:alpha-L-fucosidase
MRINGHSIYGTTASPFPIQLSFGRATSKPGVVYLHVFDWPTDGKLIVPTFGKRVRQAHLLAASKVRLKVNQTPDTLEIQGIPDTAPDKVATVIVLELEK